MVSEGAGLGAKAHALVVARRPEGHHVPRALPAGDAAADEHAGQRGLSLPQHLQSCWSGESPQDAVAQ